MAKFYADASGNITRFVQTTDDENRYGAPSGTAFTLDLDPSTNAATGQAYLAAPLTFTMPGGTLTQNGQTVAINAPSQDYQTFQLVKQAISVFKGTETLPSNAIIQSAFTACQGGTATLLQTQIVAAVLARALGMMAQRLINNGTLP